MKLLNVTWITLLMSVCYASDLEVEVTEDKPHSLDPLEIVLVCPESSVHKGEEVPRWATTIDSIAYFCNDTQETEIAE